MAGNSLPLYLTLRLENPVDLFPAGSNTLRIPAKGALPIYGYARVSVREPEGENLDLQAEQLVRAGCTTVNRRAEEAKGAKNDRAG